MSKSGRRERVDERRFGRSVRGQLRSSIRASSRRDLKLLNGEVQAHPPGQSALQGMDSGDPLTLELKRHPGARGFVGSGAVEHQIARPEGVPLALVDRVGGHPAAPRDGVRDGGHVDWRAKIDDRDVLAGIELRLQHLR
jgi:hypothetical protein